MQFSPTRGCFSQMFKKQISLHSSKQIFWHPFCLWKTPSSRFFLFSPLRMPRFIKTFSSSDFWGVKKGPCKKFHVFGENWQRNHFPKLATLWFILHPMLQLCHSAMAWNHESFWCRFKGHGDGNYQDYNWTCSKTDCDRFDCFGDDSVGQICHKNYQKKLWLLLRFCNFVWNLKSC